MSVEFIVFDDTRNHEAVDIAMEEAQRAGFTPSYFLDAEKAAEAVGFYTIGIVTSPGKYSFLGQRYEGINLIQAADILEIPRAIFKDDTATDLVGHYVRQDGGDVFVPREPYQMTQSVLRSWVSTLANAAH